MPRSRLVVVALVALVAVIAVASSCAKPETVESTAGDVAIAARLDPETARQEKNTLVLELSRAGAALAGAQVSVTAVMPPMGAMSEMRQPASVVEKKPGRYEARFDLPMQGAWTVAVDVAGPARAHQEYRVTTGVKGLTAVSSSGGAPAEGDVAYYTCAMHPSVRSATPGKCPICGMDLHPVKRASLQSGEVTVDAVRRQELGVRTAPARTAPMSTTVHAVGRVTYDETKLHDVTLKIGGYVEKLVVDKPGQSVKKGQTLLSLYSPELYAAEIELLAAAHIDQTAAGAVQQSLLGPARRRLQLWDLSDAQIDALLKEGKPKRSWPIAAPASGTVIEKNVVEGEKVDAGKTLFRLADLDTVWVEADVYEKDLPQVHIGDRATIDTSYGPRGIAGKVSFVYPYLDDKTRTARVRIELANPGGAFRPDMYADVTLAEPGPDVLQVPKEAVIVTGTRRVVFVDRGEGRLQPVDVQTGRESAAAVEITAGLSPGDLVVTSGNFVVAAESRLASATGFWAQAPAAALAEPPRPAAPAAPAQPAATRPQPSAAPRTSSPPARPAAAAPPPAKPAARMEMPDGGACGAGGTAR